MPTKLQGKHVVEWDVSLPQTRAAVYGLESVCTPACSMTETSNVLKLSLDSSEWLIHLLTSKEAGGDVPYVSGTWLKHITPPSRTLELVSSLSMAPC